MPSPRIDRVVLIGPECSGKTTLASRLARELEVPWTPEAARLFAAAHPRALSAETVEPIAHLTILLEDEALASRPRLLVRDTDLVSTVVYARHYYGSCPDWVIRSAHERLGALYLLCAPDLTWSEDGIRDRPQGRQELFEAFREQLESFGARHVEISGTGESRLENCTAAVSSLLLPVRRSDIESLHE